jgi:hypothetical protein
MAIMDPKDNARNKDLEWENRVLCSDESCIGTIGPDGRCRECGLPYEGELPSGIGAPSDAPLDAPDDDAGDADDDDNEAEIEDDGDDTIFQLATTSGRAGPCAGTRAASG